MPGNHALCHVGGLGKALAGEGNDQSRKLLLAGDGSICVLSKVHQFFGQGNSDFSWNLDTCLLLSHPLTLATWANASADRCLFPWWACSAYV